MRLAARLCIAFCVATVLAQGIILLLAGVRGNLKSDTLTKTIALLNGIDISGEQLQKMLSQSNELPIPTYEDVRDAQAEKNRTLQMREDSIRRMKEQAEEMLAELRTKTSDFDRRKNEFYRLLEEKEANLLDESLNEVRRTLEALNTEQAKEQVKRMFQSDQIDDVVAIFKDMPLDKRRKIMGEFVGPEEEEMLHEILMRTRAGEPAAGLIQEARQRLPAS